MTSKLAVSCLSRASIFEVPRNFETDLSAWTTKQSVHLKLKSKRNPNSGPQALICHHVKRVFHQIEEAPSNSADSEPPKRSMKVVEQSSATEATSHITNISNQPSEQVCESCASMRTFDPEKPQLELFMNVSETLLGGSSRAIELWHCKLKSRVQA